MRYIIKDGSESGHCCFNDSIIDTERKDGEWDHVMCECFDEEDAKVILEALNGKEPKG